MLHRMARAAGSAAIVLFSLFAAQAAGAVGFQQTTVPDPEGKPIELAIWYPSEAPASLHRLGLFQQTVAPDGAVSGAALPLIVISHGSGGGLDTHYDTALALAESGFVAVALSHPGDNWRDHSDSFTMRNLAERPRHIKAVIDYMVSAWPGHDRLDPSRIGLFGHSAGGFTGLVAIGGTPELDRRIAFCREHAEDWGCQRARARGPAAPEDAPAPPVWIHDPRIRAAVIAAPAAGYTFTPTSLAAVTAPVQLWQAEDDRVTPARWSGDIVKAALPTPPEDHLVPVAGHFAFLAPCSEALAARVPEICRDPAGFDRAAFHQTFNRSIAAFFTTRLGHR